MLLVVGGVVFGRFVGGSDKFSGEIVGVVVKYGVSG